MVSSVTYENSTPWDVLTPFERAQSINFVTRYEHLPLPVSVKIVKHKSLHLISNIADLRHALNEYRSLIQNQSDSVYFKNVHSVWRRMLACRDPTKGTVIRTCDESGADNTEQVLRGIDDCHSALCLLCERLDYGYLYNGILQHSDPDLSHRFVMDYTSGELNYIFWKHAHMLTLIRDLLEPYYCLARGLTRPPLGPL